MTKLKYIEENVKNFDEAIQTVVESGQIYLEECDAHLVKSQIPDVILLLVYWDNYIDAFNVTNPIHMQKLRKLLDQVYRCF
ncbi:MAG: hypothetical protein JZD41_07570 [Thermoproteus sp.]|nr:hypothetical protein [Thermoproteus sp.]